METEVPGPAGETRPDPTIHRAWPTSLAWMAVALMIALIAFMASGTNFGRPGAGDVAVAYTEAPPPQGPTVSLAIDFGNGAKREYSAVNWKDGMTAGDLMKAASLLSPGLAYEVRGTGEMTLLTSLDGVANGAGDGRYWLYEINGRHANVSFAVQPLSAGDRVLWVFKQPE